MTHLTSLEQARVQHPQRQQQHQEDDIGHHEVPGLVHFSWRVGGLWGFVAPEFKRFNSNVITAKARGLVPKLHTELTKIGKTIYGEGVETNWCHRELSITTTCAGLMEDIKASWCRKYHHQASRQAGEQAGWQAGRPYISIRSESAKTLMTTLPTAAAAAASSDKQ